MGQITSTTDILGNVTSYIYDNKGLLTGITLPDNTPDNPNDNPKISKKYDAADRLIEETSTTGLVTKYVYDELGRLTETVVPDLTPNNWDDNPKIKNEYTLASRLKGKTDIFGNWENFEYDNLGRLKREGQFEVYNFKVEGFHTYFVSDLGILVHNADCTQKAWDYLKRLESKGQLGDGRVIRIENANGGTLPEPPAGYPEQTHPLLCITCKKINLFIPFCLKSIGIF